MTYVSSTSESASHQAHVVSGSLWADTTVILEFVVDNYIDTFLGDTRLCGEVLMCYLSICRDHARDGLSSVFDRVRTSRTGILFSGYSIVI